MLEEIALTYKYELQEYMLARIFHVLRDRTKTEKVIDFLIIVFAIVCWYYFGFSFIWLLLICFPLLILLVAGFVAWIQYQQEPRCKDVINLRFSDDAIYFKNEYIDSKIEWQLYKKILENKQMFLLYYGKKIFTIVPKRIFKDKNQEEVFRSLIHHKILGK